jgi:hypothetical protein
MTNGMISIVWVTVCVTVDSIIEGVLDSPGVEVCEAAPRLREG